MPARANKASDLAAVLNTNPVLDMDNVYLSDQGWAYRHYKNESKTRFWDEILVAGEVASADTPDTFGAASPTFETGDSVQSPKLTLAPVVLVAPDADLVADSTGNVFSVSANAEVTDETYAWTLVGSPAGSAITAGGTTAEATITAPTAPGDYTIQCVITSATAADSPVTVAATYTVVAA